MLSESRLNRRLYEIDISVWQSIFNAVSKVFCNKNESLEYLIDSMPVEVCLNVRSYRYRLLRGKQFIVFCKAKKKFYYGFKIHMITTGSGKPVEFIITPYVRSGYYSLRLMKIDLPQGASIYGDKAYTHYSFEDDLQEFEKIKLMQIERQTQQDNTPVVLDICKLF